MAKNDQFARQFQQLHDCAKFLIKSGLLSNSQKTIETIKQELQISDALVGFARDFAIIAIVYSYEIAKDNKPDFADLKDEIDLSVIGVKSGFSKATNSRITNGSGGECDKEAVFRHLRNSFGHARYEIISDSKKSTINMEDYDGPRKTFEGTCEIHKIVALAERLLIKSHRIMSTTI